ncbi:HAD-IIIC family phosphatase [Streptomyces sp. NPDC000594]|uniref:HAD-IIIC family phosphatase n=1 Tax=Streptomyces sp. NPDC000594 TaxID=3154261 RepID=UPI00331F9F2E
MTRDLFTVAATFTADPLLPLLRDALEHIEAPHRVESAPYGQLVEQLLSPSSHFARNTSGINAGLVRIADWAGSAERVDAFMAAVREFAAAQGRPTVLVLCPDPPPPPGPGEPAAGAARLLAGVREVPGIAPVDAADWFDAYGCRDIHDPGAASIAHIPYTEEAFAVLALGLARVVRSTLVRPRKVIVADCDETLWGGACGDRPPRELELGGDFARVRDFLRLRHDEGFVLALASRNDPESVARVFAERTGELGLTREHFAAARVNWKPKSQNIRSLAEELGLGTDSFVLVDDDPYVCAEVAEALPEVAVVQVGPGTDPPALLRHCWELDRFFSTAEDRTRNAGYRAEALRREAAAGAPDTARLNERLGTVVTVARAVPGDLPRITQLLARTNQFTSATVSATGLPALLERPGATAWTARLRDRFGDYGTIAAAVATPAGGTVRLDCFAMSCRALERGVAEALFAAVADDADARELRVGVRRTGRNGPALDFLRRHGAEAPTVRAPHGSDPHRSDPHSSAPHGSAPHRSGVTGDTGDPDPGDDPLADLAFVVPVARLVPSPTEGTTA